MQPTRHDTTRLTARLSAISAAKAVEPARFVRASRRAEQREPTYRFARLLIGARSVVCCIIKDLSPAGARIMMEGASDLPERVILSIDQSGQRYRARVAWRREHEAGLSLIAELSPRPRPIRVNGADAV